MFIKRKMKQYYSWLKSMDQKNGVLYLRNLESFIRFKERANNAERGITIIWTHL